MSEAPILQLHAPDRAGALAFDAAPFASLLALHLHAVASPLVTPAKRVEAMERLFIAWPSLCSRMASLAEVAPRSVEAGEREAEKHRDFIERRGK